MVEREGRGRKVAPTIMSSSASANSPAPPADAPTLDEIANSFADGEARIARRVLDAITVSEQAVLNVGDSIGDIVAHGREQVEASARLAARFGQDSEISRAIAQQSDDMSVFLSRMTKRLQEQQRQTRELHDQLGRIVAAGDRIRAIARETKIVTVNAQIEAARLGPVGKPFVIIAEQLASLADDVGVANRLVGQLARTMVDVMPRLATTSESLVDDSNRFHETFAEALKKVEDTQKQLHENVHQAITEGERRSERVLQGSQAALSQLQFQDPMAQSLREISRITGRTRKQLEQALGCSLEAHCVAEDGQTLRVGELMAKLSGAQEVSLRESIQQENNEQSDAPPSDVDTPDSGDVLLF